MPASRGDRCLHQIFTTTRQNASMRTAFVFLTLTLVGAAGLPGLTQTPRMKDRAAAYVQALSSGSPEQFEAMAQANFTPELLAKTRDQRARMLERVHNDFGALTIATEDATSPTHVDLGMKSDKNAAPMTIGMDFEAAAPFRIAGVTVRVGGPAGGGREGGPPPLPAPPVNRGMTSAEISVPLDGYLSTLSNDGAFAGVVLVAKDGQKIFEKAYGTADRERNTPMTTDLRFNLASIGKAFTKTAIGQLIQSGTLKPTDRLGQLLPDYPVAEARPATIDQLLHFQVGIADFFGEAFDKAPKDRFASNHDYYLFVAPQPLSFKPGERTVYCNGCYVVLGEIIARVSGMTYERYVEQHVFAKAGMQSAGFLAYGDPQVAPGYTRPAPGAPWASAVDRHGRHGSGAGGAYATADDLLAFDNALRTHALLDAKTTAWYFDNPDDEKLPRARDAFGIAGGAPGANSSIESNGTWTIVTLGNLDPPNAVRVGTALAGALDGG